MLETVDDDLSVTAEHLRDAIFDRDVDRLQSRNASRFSIQCVTESVVTCTADVQCLRVLLNYIPDIDYVNVCSSINDNTMLIEATKNNKVDCVQVLLDHGANVNARSGNDETALLHACDDRYYEVFDLLIKKGADVHYAGPYGNAITMAAYENAVRCLRKLLSCGVSIYERNFSGKTAFSIACKYGNEKFIDEMLDYLISHGEGNYSDKKENVIESIDCSGKTPLMYSCEKGNMNIVKTLLKHGAKINVQDKQGKTALMYAILNNKDECFHLLLKEGADLNIVNKKGMTMFVSAVRGDGKILDLLLQDSRVICDGVLKSHHKASLLEAIGTKYDFTFNFTSLMLLIAYKCFDWDWCVQDTCDPLDTFIPPAIRSSICPGTFNYKGFDMSVLPLAVAYSDSPTIKFLLAHRYFFPEDYALLSASTSFRKEIHYGDPYSSGEVSKILDQLSTCPLSLQTWSFLTVSKAISQGGHPAGRAVRVDALPLPEKMKKTLKFKTNITELCSRNWAHLTIAQAFDSLNFRETLCWRDDLKCKEECLECGNDFHLCESPDNYLLPGFGRLLWLE